MRRHLVRIVIIIAALLALFLFIAAIAGWAYEQVGRNRDRHLYPQVGKSIDIGGRSLNLYCSGQGGPAVIFEAGGEVGGYSWALVQPEVAKLTRACWYDRAGEGWSDPPPAPRTSGSVVDDLHELLHRAQIQSPYILVGASVGGEYARVFAWKFPSEVAGMVLVDSSHPDQHEPASMKSQFNLMSPGRRRFFCALIPSLSRFGLLRLMTGPQPGFVPPTLEPKNAAAVSRFLANRPATMEASAEQSCSATRNGSLVPDGGTGNPELDDAARASGSLGDTPLVVLTAGQPFVPPDPRDKQEAAEFHEAWIYQLQPQLAALSSRGRQVIVPNSAHAINFEAPEEIVKAVRDVLEQVRIPKSH